jgi:hypothetical protein
LHPALVYLLLKASSEIYGGPGWVHRAGEFPSIKTQDFPVAEEAQRYYKSGGSALYDYLPFWAATLMDRMILVLIPLGVVIIPTLGIMPWVYTYRNRSKYYRFYRALRNIDEELRAEEGAPNPDELHAKLDQIEQEVGRLQVSIVFFDELFILEEHIRLIRDKVSSLSDKSRRES